MILSKIHYYEQYLQKTRRLLSNTSIKWHDKINICIYKHLKCNVQGKCSIRLGSIFFSSHVYAMRSIETCECFELGLMMVLMRIQKLWIVSGSAPVAQSGCAHLNNGHKKKKGFRGKEFGLPIFCPVDIRPILNVRKMSICLPYERVIWTSYEPLISVVWPLGSL